MANELITREDIVRGKQNFDAFDKYLDGGAEEAVALPGGKKIKTLAGLESDIFKRFPENSVGMKTSGIRKGQVPLSEDVLHLVNGASFNIVVVDSSDPVDCDDFGPESRYFVRCKSSARNMPPQEGFEVGYVIETLSGIYGGKTQTAYGHSSNVRFHRTRSVSLGRWEAWVPITPTIKTYSTTTADPANVVVTGTGELQRTTSSRVFKDRIKNLDIEDYRALLKSVQPVSYHSKNTSDDPDRIWYSFIAEDLVEVDSRLVQLSPVEFYEDTDEEGNTFVNSRELPEGELAPSGLNLNGIVTMLTRINQYMLDDIEALEAEKTQLKSRMTKLENRLESLEKQLASE